MTWTKDTPLPFFVLVMGLHAVIIHPLYHSEAIDRNASPFPHSRWQEEVEEIIEGCVKEVPRKQPPEGSENTNSNSNKKRRPTGIKTAKGLACSIPGCQEKTASPRCKVCVSCHTRVCKYHGSADNYKHYKYNDVVHLVFKVATQAQAMTEHNFICLNCTRIKLIQKLQTICARNAVKKLCENKTMQQLRAEYYINTNNPLANNNNDGEDGAVPMQE
ncbi:unnamed protein product [Vitrella brassicaformis CCMP3155]|uniref:Uncharacterized protein n=1 Tax=Vitrella brassicaformis (strain CCMP3155) TaxID=1169540 RepID=A0A0G4FRT6_VITBC|nr:unnamed protein product [Vitrella brassicaformis CCMP3155]|eukprot:CEM16815.1 unnamed protein product [Vitrella brassicaformis CCMP3155]